MTKQEKYDRYFMDIALRTAEMSYAEKRKVGCIITKDNHIIAEGWNGQPSGYENSCEYTDENGKLKTFDTVLHAEANAIYWCAKSKISTNNSTVYITLSPCKNCALALIQAGIARIVYKDDYWNKDKTGMDLLKKSGIEIKKLS